MRSSYANQHPPIGRSAGRSGQGAPSAGVPPAAGGDETIFATTDPLAIVIDEELGSEVRMRVRRLLADLVANDLAMAFLDLSHLHRVVCAMDPDKRAGVRRGLEQSLYAALD